MTMNSEPMCDDNSGNTSGDFDAGQSVGDTPASAVPAAAPSAEQSGSNIQQARQQVGEVAQEVRDAASQAGTAVTDATRRTAAQAKDAAARMMEQARDQAKQLTQQLTQQAGEHGASMFNDQKSRVANSIGGVASTLRRAAETLHEEQDKNLANYTESLADGIESCAAYLRDADPRRLMADAGNFARRRPELVLGGAFIAGLALVRFLKASRSDTGVGRYDDGGDTSHLGYATSDQFMRDDNFDGDDLVSRYRVGAHPGIGGTTPDAGPDVDQPQEAIGGGGSDFARTDAALDDQGPDVAVTTPAVVPEATGVKPATSLNPDENANANDQRTRTQDVI
jgi:hypothetical protein